MAMQDVQPIITIRNLKAQYGEKVILHGINADIYEGQVTVILGSSGCGKTTLLKNMLRLHEPVEGSVKFWGTEVLGLEEIEFNNMLKKVGMLFQNGALLNSISVMDNIAIPLEQHTKLSRRIIEKMIRVKLNLVGLSHAIHLLPSELSGGMKKRAGLARAMIMDPLILFCDEPSAGLDPLTSASLDELIMDLKSQLNMTIVMVTHELASIHRVADRVLFMDQGRLLFQGTLDEARAARIPEIDTFFEVGKFE